jgi:predicted TIM-barrel fold metal-dependent hydrolase
MTQPIFDTHLHLVYLDRFSYPWLADVPAINRQWTAGSYFAEAEALGIEAALHMEVDVAASDSEAETRFMTGVHSKVVGAIAAGRPESADFGRQLETLVSIGHVKGIRRVLHTSPDALSQSALFAENLRRLKAYDLGFDLCVRADQLLTVGLPLAKKCSDIQFVLDHCGVPNIAAGAFEPWRDAITEIARLSNVVCKVSGIIAYAGEHPTAATLKPYVEHVISSFGWDRVLWGSDHPVCTLTANLTKWVGVTRELVGSASAGEQAKLLRENARRIYGI